MASCNNKNPVSVNIDFNHQIFGDRLRVKKNHRNRMKLIL